MHFIKIRVDTFSIGVTLFSLIVSQFPINKTNKCEIQSTSKNVKYMLQDLQRCPKGQEEIRCYASFPSLVKCHHCLQKENNIFRRNRSRQITA